MDYSIENFRPFAETRFGKDINIELIFLETAGQRIQQYEVCLPFLDGVIYFVDVPALVGDFGGLAKGWNMVDGLVNDGPAIDISYNIFCYKIELKK